MLTDRKFVLVMDRISAEGVGDNGCPHFTRWGDVRIPSKLVVANALRQCLPEFLVNSAKTRFFAKFIAERQDPDTFEMFRLGT